MNNEALLLIINTPERRLSPTFTGIRTGLLISAVSLAAGAAIGGAIAKVNDMLLSTNQDLATAAKPDKLTEVEKSIAETNAMLDAGRKQRLQGHLLDLDVSCQNRRAITGIYIWQALMDSEPLNAASQRIMDETLDRIQSDCLLDNLTSNTSKARASDLPPSILTTLNSTEEGKWALAILRAIEARQSSSPPQE